jgi:hypothetical protein
MDLTKDPKFPYLTTKEQRQLDYKPWEKKFWAAYKFHKGRIDEIVAKGKRYDNLTKQQMKIFESKKSTPEAAHDAALRIIEYGTFRDIYLELGRNAAILQEMDIRLIEAQSDTNLHDVMIESVGHLSMRAAQSITGLDSQLPKAFRQVRSEVKRLRIHVSKTGVKAETAVNQAKPVSEWYARFKKHKPTTGQDGLDEMFP